MSRLRVAAAVLALLILPGTGRGSIREADGGGAVASAALLQIESNRWTYAEAGNSCTATRTSGRDWFQLRVTRWRDLSDAILFHRPGLALLWSEEGAPTGRTEAQERADAEAFYHLEVRIDRRRVDAVGGFNAMLLDHDNRPGPTYRFSVRQQPFLSALGTGRTLELFQRGRRFATIPIRGSAGLARRLAACAARPVRAG